MPINNRTHMKQIVSFAGLEQGKLAPTDLDGMVEYHNAGYFIFEMKHGEVPVPRGQMLCLERLADDLSTTGKIVWCCIARHQHPSSEDIIARDAVVDQVRINGEWVPGDGNTVHIWLLRFYSAVNKLEYQQSVENRRGK